MFCRSIDRQSRFKGALSSIWKARFYFIATRGRRSTKYIKYFIVSKLLSEMKGNTLVQKA